MPANIIVLDGASPFAASHFGLFCLPLSHNKDASLKWVRRKRVIFQLNDIDIQILRHFLFFDSSQEPENESSF